MAWQDDQVIGGWQADEIVGKPEKPDQRTPAQRAMQELAAGGVRGAGSIGATLLTPYDLIAGNTKSIGNPERRQAMDDAIQGLGVDTGSGWFKGGKLATEVAGTSGAGGLIAKGLAAIPGAAQAMPGVINAIRTGGFSTGNAATTLGGKTADMGVRMLGGGISGGAAAGLIDPESAGTGATIGALLPPGMKAAGLIGQGVSKGAKKLATNVLGMTTGVGPEPIRQAFKAGQTGSQDFVQNMKGEVPLTDVLDRAKQGLHEMRMAKSAEYRSGMIPIAGDKSVLGFGGIDKALDDAMSVATYKGQVKNESAASVLQKMRAVVDEWRGLDPAEFHTPEGLDALKQKLGGLLEGIPYQEKTARLAAGKVYNAAKTEIERQAPTYAKVMRDYSEASDLISEIERALSLGDKASKDTAMRKLQSLMRNNVQTNYGNRLNLATALEQGGGVDLMPSIAGQALNSWTPRSLSGQIGSGGAGLAAMMGHPGALAALPLQSPRLVGSAAYGLGRLSSYAPQAVQFGAGSGPLLLGQNALEEMAYRFAPQVAVGGR